MIFKNLKSASEDPPDCTAEDGNGSLIGFEVTELVDEKVIQKNIEIEKNNSEKNQEDQMSGIYRDWSGEEIVKKLGNILADKDSKNFKGGPYKRLILIVHNDELGLILEEIKKALENHEFKQTSQIDEAYLLLSYRPDQEPSYPLIPLKIKKGYEV